MKILPAVLVILLLAPSLVGTAQRRPSRGAIEGTVLSVLDQPRGVLLTLEASGQRYEFPLVSTTADVEPEIVGNVRSAGSRVKVFYNSLSRYRDGSYYGTATRIVELNPAGSSSYSAEEAWPSFLRALKSAVQRRDRADVMSLMSRDFVYSCCDNYDENRNGDLRDEALHFWDERTVRGWTALSAVLAKGAVAAKSRNYDGRVSVPRKVAPPAARRPNYKNWTAEFEFRNGDWRLVRFSVAEGD
jgi:hypothetical protein